MALAADRDLGEVGLEDRGAEQVLVGPVGSVVVEAFGRQVSLPAVEVAAEELVPGLEEVAVAVRLRAAEVVEPGTARVQVVVAVERELASAGEREAVWVPVARVQVAQVRERQARPESG